MRTHRAGGRVSTLRDRACGLAVVAFFLFRYSARYSPRPAPACNPCPDAHTHARTLRYLASWFFKSPSLAINLTLVTALGNVILVLGCFAMSAIKVTCREYGVVKWLILAFPPFAFGDGVWRVATLGFLPLLDNACELQHNPDTFDQSRLSETWTALEWRVIGPQIAYMLVLAPVCLILALAFDFVAATPALQLIVCKLCLRDTADPEEQIEPDAAVEAEEDRCLNDPASKRTDVVRVTGLRRAYGVFKPKLAVQNMNFGIRHGECFGLLGVNGAGKSTTMKMLTADVLPTRGTAMLGGFDILKSQYQVRQLLGYCPQTNPLLPLVTVLEHLKMFGRIKGIKESDLNAVCETRMTELSLLPFKNKRAGDLSGGNKRKLCVAIALIGEPLVIFLDEPSAGMDPVAKRHMWDLISSMSATVIITTHLMEEASALCDRITIMVDGKLRCLGSEQELKNTYVAQPRSFGWSCSAAARRSARHQSRVVAHPPLPHLSLLALSSLSRDTTPPRTPGAKTTATATVTNSPSS